MLNLRNIWLYSIKNLKHSQTNYVEELDFPVKESSAFKYVLKNTKVNLKHYQMNANKKKIWEFKMVERFNYTKIKQALNSEQNSEDEICSRRSTIDFNDLEDDQEDAEIDKQNPFLLGSNIEDDKVDEEQAQVSDEESENSMFKEESVDKSDNDLAELVVSEHIPQAKIVGYENGVRKFISSDKDNENKPV